MTQWKAGESGNPRGRPKGTGKLQKLRDRHGRYLPELFDRLMVQALWGDLGAAKLVLEYLVPRPRPEALPIYLPDFNVDSPLMQQGQQVMQAVAEGRIPPNTGSELIAALATCAEIKHDQLAERLRALEDKGAFDDLA